MNGEDFEHEPLGRVVKGITDSSELSTEELKKCLVEKGYDVDALQAQIEATIRTLSKESRLTWMQAAEANQARLASALSGFASWATKSVEEIDHAFHDVIDGKFGAEAQMKVQTAFRNAESLPPQSKAAFLDEIEALIALNRKPDSEEKQ